MISMKEHMQLIVFSNVQSSSSTGKVYTFKLCKNK